MDRKSLEKWTMLNRRHYNPGKYKSFDFVFKLILGNISSTPDSGRDTGTSTSSRLAMDSGKKWIQLVSAGSSSAETGFVSDQSHKSQKKQQTTKLMGPYNQLYSRPSLISRSATASNLSLSTTVNVSNFQKKNFENHLSQSSSVNSVYCSATPAENPNLMMVGSDVTIINGGGLQVSHTSVMPEIMVSFSTFYNF